MASDLALYPILAGSRIRSQVQYRVSFVLYVLGNLALTGVDFLAVLVLFEHLPLLAGWSLAEIAFLYGTSYMSFKATDMVLGHLDTLGAFIREGTLDVMLTRPMGSLMQVMTADFALRQLGGVIQGAVVFTFAITSIDVDWSPGKLLMLPVMLVSGAFIFGSVWVIGASTMFWTQGAGIEALNTFTYGGNAMTTYPLNIYASWLRRVLAFVVPLAFVNYFPSLYILGKEDPLGSPEVLQFLSPLVAVVMVTLARLAWGTGIRHYRSTGS